jgi:hypothetical protein
MKLNVDGKTYDITESLQGAAIGDLLKLKVKTKTPEFIGVTVKFIQRTFTAVGEGARVRADRSARGRGLPAVYAGAHLPVTS